MTLTATQLKEQPAPELPKVRIATVEDEPEILVLCRALHDENGLFSYSERRVRECLQRCWERKGTIVGVIGPRGGIQATTCLVISDFYYTEQWHLAELWNYVAEPYRASHNVDALLDFCKSSADQLGIPLLAGIITNDRLAEKVRLYRKRLGPPAGAWFVHGAKWQSGVEPMPDDFWRPFRRREPRKRNGSE